MDRHNTEMHQYTTHLLRIQDKSWKKSLVKLNPYRAHIRRVVRGRVLEVGCGIGRCLAFMDADAVGVDHNVSSVSICRGLGLDALTPDEFENRFAAEHERFDSLLLSHVLEHMNLYQARELVSGYLPYCRDRCRLVLITPQEVGFRSDTTHVEFIDHDSLSSIGDELGFSAKHKYSFPFPRRAGRVFVYNEFVYIGDRLKS